MDKLKVGYLPGLPPEPPGTPLPLPLPPEVPIMPSANIPPMSIEEQGITSVGTNRPYAIRVVVEPDISYDLIWIEITHSDGRTESSEIHERRPLQWVKFIYDTISGTTTGTETIKVMNAKDPNRNITNLIGTSTIEVI